MGEVFKDQPVRKEYKDGSIVVSNVKSKIDNASTSYTVVDTWYDGTPMDDSKVDRFGIYTKYKDTGEYLKENKPQWGELFLEVDTVADLRALSDYFVFLLRFGYYKGVRLLGYYRKNDTSAINYFVSVSIDPDDGGSIFQVGNLKLEHDFNGTVNVKHFGAVGNWNNYDFTGNNDTLPIQRAINYLSRSRSTVRKGKPRVVYFPNGNYYVDSFAISGRDENDVNLFGLVFQGETRGAVLLSFNHEILDVPAITCNEEAVSWINMFFNGSKSYPANAADKRDLLFKFKKWSNHADIDTYFLNCGFVNFKRGINFHGRGATFDNCMYTSGGYFLNIQCDEDIIFEENDPTGMQGVRVGYRHYAFRGGRVDGTSVLVRIEGNGEQKDYIHDLMINAVEGTAPDVLIMGDDCSLRSPIISSCNFRVAVRTGAVKVKSIYNGIDDSNVWISNPDVGKPGMTIQDTIIRLYQCTNIYGLRISSYISRISNAVVRVSGQARDIIITGCIFDEFFKYSQQSVNYIVSSVNKVDGLIISNNTFHTDTLPSVPVQACNPAVQFPSANYYFENNTANFPIVSGAYQRIKPKVYAGPAEMLNQSSVNQYQFKVDQQVVKGCFQLVLAFNVAENGNLTAELPFIPLPVNTGISSFYSGKAEITEVFNNTKNVVFANPMIDIAGNRLLIRKKNTDGSISNFTVADLPETGNLGLIGNMEYKMK